MKNIFQKRLQDELAIRKYSGKLFSEMTGISEATISRYLSGIRQPTNDNLVLAAKYLEVSTDYLLGLTDSKAPVTLSNDLDKLINCYLAAIPDDKDVVWAVLKKYL